MRKISSKFVRACRENFSTWNVLHSKNYGFDPKTLFLFFLDTRSKNPKQPTSTDTASANTENTETTRFPTDKNKLSQARLGKYVRICCENCSTWNGFPRKNCQNMSKTALRGMVLVQKMPKMSNNIA